MDALARRSYRTGLSYAELHSTTGAALRLDFSPGLTVLTGGNGAGKSSTLGALARCLDDREQWPIGTPERPPWLTSLKVHGTTDGAAWERAVQFNDPDDALGRLEVRPSVPVLYLDPAASMENLIRRYLNDESPNDLIEGLDPTEFDGEDLELASFLLRRQYSSLGVYEVTAFSGEDEPDPWFVSSVMGTDYSLLNMGRGELTALYLIWKLGNVEPGSVVLLEEPEAHLATFSHDALVDVLVHLIHKRDITLVVSSHSPSFFERLPNGSVALVSSLPAPQIRSHLSTSEIASHLGSPAIGAVHLITEDRVGAALLRALIQEVDRQVLRRASIWYATSGESGVRRVIGEIEKGEGGAAHALLGILDGDQRPTEDASGEGLFAYLVGAAPPEGVLRHAFDSWRTGEHADWSPQLPGGEDALRLVLERIDGLDHHDWLEELRREYGGLDTFLGGTVSILLLDQQLASQAEELLRAIRGVL